MREFLLSISHDNNLTAIQHYPKEERNDAIRQLREYGASIRQITRITGVSEGIIRNIK